MDDLISRKAAIDALFKLYEYQRDIDPTEAADLVRQGVYLAEKKIEQLPSAQQDSKETSPTHKALDTISRQAAIRWVKTECNPYGKPTLDFESGKKVIEHLKQMPSAQPETHDKCTETHACDLISRKAAIDELCMMLRACFGADDEELDAVTVTLNNMPSAQPELIEREAYIRGFEQGKTQGRLDALSAQPETHEERTETHACDCISRQAAINALTSHIMPHNNEDGTVTIGVLSKSSIKNILNKLPSVQPEHTNSCYTNSWCIDCKEYDTENKCCPRYNRVIKQTLDDAYRHGETEAEARFYAEIVRCKDCKHWNRESICDGFCSEDCMRHDEDFYCGYAERRTDEPN